MMKKENENEKVLIKFGMSIIILTFIYFFSTTFIIVPQGNNDIRNLILGYVSGILSTLAGYYWGSSASSKSKDKTIQTMNDNNAQNGCNGDNCDSDGDVTSGYNSDSDDDDFTPPIKG